MKPLFSIFSLPKTNNLFLILLPTLLLATVLSSHAAHASTIIVNSLADDFVRENAQACTLRAAVQAANHNQTVAGCVAGETGSDTIRFANTGVLTLTAGQLVISESLTLFKQDAWQVAQTIA